MKNEVFKEYKKELEKQYHENREKINDCLKKLQVLEKNSYDSKIGESTLFSAMSMLLPILAIYHYSIWPEFLTANPIPFTNNLFTAFSLSTGILGQKLVDKCRGTKKELKKFSNAKTQRENIEETVRYKTEMLKVMDCNEILENVINSLEVKMAINFLHESNDLDKKQIEENMKNIEKLLAETYKKIEYVTSKTTLDRYSELKAKKNWSEISINGLSTGLLSTLYCNLPFIGISLRLQNYSVPIEILFAQILVPFLIGSASSIIYQIKKQKDVQKACEQINKEIQEQFSVYEEELNYSELMGKAYELHLMLIEQKSLFENRKKEEQTHNELEKTVKPIMENEQMLGQENSSVLVRKRTLHHK